MLQRISLLILLILGVFIAPWWLVLVATLLAVLWCKRFLEGLIPVVVMDLLHGPGTVFGIPAFSTIAVCLALILVSYSELYLRDHVRA